MLDDGTGSGDTSLLLNKWKTDFEILFNGTSDDASFDDRLLEQADALYREWDRQIPQAEHQDTDEQTAMDILNSPLDIDEMRKALQRAKLGKATGIDKIPNEIHKHPGLLYALHRLYCACYDKNIIPSIWCKSIQKFLIRYYLMSLCH
jgi:hypothetical protein